MLASVFPILDIMVRRRFWLAGEILKVSKERMQRSQWWPCLNLSCQTSCKEEKKESFSCPLWMKWHNYHRIRVERKFNMFLQATSSLLNIFCVNLESLENYCEQSLCWYLEISFSRNQITENSNERIHSYSKWVYPKACCARIITIPCFEHPLYVMSDT